MFLYHLPSDRGMAFSVSANSWMIWACFKQLCSYINSIQMLNTSVCWPCIHPHSRYRYFLITWIKIFTRRQPASLLRSKESSEFKGFQSSTVTLFKQRPRSRVPEFVTDFEKLSTYWSDPPNARSCLSRNAHPTIQFYQFLWAWPLSELLTKLIHSPKGGEMLINMQPKVQISPELSAFRLMKVAWLSWWRMGQGRRLWLMRILPHSVNNQDQVHSYRTAETS